MSFGGGGGGANPAASGPSGFNAGKNGGSGVVIIRVPSAVVLAGNPTCATTLSTHPGGDKIAKFTASAVLTVSLA